MRRSRKTVGGINEELYEAHIEYLLANFSKEEAESANVAWGQGYDRIETKIGAKPPAVLTSS